MTDYEHNEHNYNYCGVLTFMRPKSARSQEADGVEDWGDLFWALHREVPDNRMLELYEVDHCHGDGQMGYSIDNWATGLSPHTAIKLLRDMALIIGRWGYFFKGDLICVCDNTCTMFHIFIDRHRVRYYRYDHGSHDTDAVDVKLVKEGEHTLGELSSIGTLPKVWEHHAERVYRAEHGAEMHPKRKRQRKSEEEGWSVVIPAKGKEPERRVPVEVSFALKK